MKDKSILNSSNPTNMLDWGFKVFITLITSQKIIIPINPVKVKIPVRVNFKIPVYFKEMIAFLIRDFGFSLSAPSNSKRINLEPLPVLVSRQNFLKADFWPCFANHSNYYFVYFQFIWDPKLKLRLK
jgi:hypothetical protein